MLNGFDQHI